MLLTVFMDQRKLTLSFVASAFALLVACSSTSSPTEAVSEGTAPLITDPSTLGPLRVWLDPREGVTTSNGEVTSWTARGAKPVVMARGNPNEPGITQDPRRPEWVRFTGNAVATPYLVNSDVVLAPPMTIGIVLRPTGGNNQTGYEPMALLGSTAPTISIAERCTWGFDIHAPTCRMAAQSGPGGPQFSWLQGGTGSYALNARHVVVAVFNGASSSLLVDSAAPVNGNLTVASLNGLVLNAGGRPFIGDMGDVLVYASALGPSEQYELREFLASRYP